VVVGRVRDIVKGLAAFRLIDASLGYCGSGVDTMDDCATPWDYCCIDESKTNAMTIFVEGESAGGRVVPAASIPGLRLLDFVAVRGRLEKDEHGVVTLHASGWFRRERPNLRDGLQWPE
ncbi:MAG: hypothetical protein ACREID_07630, partial [Planctomycetota bacterium]